MWHAPLSLTSQINDVTGDKRFHSLTPMFTHRNTAILLVADASNMDSVPELQYHYDIMQRHCRTYRLAVVLNKIDRADPAVQQAVAQFAARYDLPVIALSAATMACMDSLVAFIDALPVP